MLLCPEHKRAWPRTTLARVMDVPSQLYAYVLQRSEMGAVETVRV
jgi:hypothetical protein